MEVYVSFNLLVFSRSALGYVILAVAKCAMAICYTWCEYVLYLQSTYLNEDSQDSGTKCRFNIITTRSLCYEHLWPLNYTSGKVDTDLTNLSDFFLLLCQEIGNCIFWYNHFQNTPSDQWNLDSGEQMWRRAQTKKPLV